MKKWLDKQRPLISKILHTEEETTQFGQEFARDIKEGMVIALHGDLGSGKTTFVKGIVSQIGVMENVQSPTFTYLNLYETDPPIYHFDLYRLKGEEEFIQWGFPDFFGERGICLIEWAERIDSLLPKTTIHITLLQMEEGRRRIDVYKI